MIAIVHITDFHIVGTDTDGDPLRDANFDDFINSLVSEIEKDAGDVEKFYVVATGDFIHQGTKAAFPHSSKVLKYLASKLSISTNDIFVCMGNHDFDLAEERAGYHDAARKEFRSFSADFGGTRDDTGEHHEFFSRESVCFLMLDSTLGGDPEKPGVLGAKQEDAIKMIVKEKVQRDQILVVGSHHPVNMGLAQLSHVDDATATEHFWKGGIQLAGRISRARKECAPSIWLSGDIHFADRRFDDEIFHVVTARFGTPRDPTSSVHRQARILYVSREALPVMTTLSFDPGTHRDHGSLGHWEIRNSKQPFLNVPSSAATATATATDAATISSITSPASSSKVVRIDEGLEVMIVSAVGELGVYKLGKFATNSKIISAAWVSIGPLLNLPEVFSTVIDRVGNWITSEVGLLGYEASDVLCIGVDCWGAVLSSQLSVFKGFNNTCVAARGNAEHSSHWETVSDRVVERAAAAKIIVFVSDVISTCKTIRFIWEKLRESPLFHDPDSKRVFAACLIADGKVSKDDDFISSIGACCCALRMPVFSVDDFPSDAVIPTQISFS